MKNTILLSLILPLMACSQMPVASGNKLMVDGNSITFTETGSGTPTVVFESGLGDGQESWASIYDDVSGFAHTFAYSRPGYSAGPRQMEIGGERTAQESARFLKTLLDQKGVPAPYVLVGHSVGGLYILEFARLYPGLVAAIVLVDGRVPGFTEACKEADIGLCAPPAFMAAVSPAHISAEIRGIKPSEKVAPTPAEMGAIPTTLIVATKPPPGGSRKVQPIWIDAQRAWSDELENGRFVIADGSGHYIHKDAPDVVIREIRRTLDQLNQGVH